MEIKQELIDSKNDGDGMVVEDFDEFLRLASVDRDNGYVFRGVDSDEYEFVPSILYFLDDQELINLQNEDRNLEKLLEKYEELIHDPITIIELARHFGFRCRFMDITEDPLIALFFACKSNDDRNGVVYSLNRIEYTKKHNQITNTNNRLLNRELIDEIKGRIWDDVVSSNFYDKKGEDLGELELNYPVFVYPSFVDERISFQRGLFLTWLDLSISNEEIDKELLSISKKYIIRSDEKNDFMKELEKLGYTEKTLQLSKEISSFLCSVNINPDEFEKFCNGLNKKQIQSM